MTWHDINTDLHKDTNVMERGLIKQSSSPLYIIIKEVPHWDTQNWDHTEWPHRADAWTCAPGLELGLRTKQVYVPRAKKPCHPPWHRSFTIIYWQVKLIHCKSGYTSHILSEIPVLSITLWPRRAFNDSLKTLVSWMFPQISIQSKSLQNQTIKRECYQPNFLLWPKATYRP